MTIITDAHGKRLFGVHDRGYTVIELREMRKTTPHMCPCDLGFFGACNEENDCETQSGIELAWLTLIEAFWLRGSYGLRLRMMGFRTMPKRVP